MSGAGPRQSRLRFAQRTIVRGTAQIAKLIEQKHAAEALAAVLSEDPEGWRARRAACQALARLRRRGWRPSPDGRWRAPDGRLARDLEEATRALVAAMSPENHEHRSN